MRQKITGNTCVTADQGTVPVRLATTVVAEHTDRRIPQIQGQLGSEIPIGKPSNTVGSKHTRHMHPLFHFAHSYIPFQSTSPVPLSPRIIRHGCAVPVCASMRLPSVAHPDAIHTCEYDLIRLISMPLHMTNTCACTQSCHICRLLALHSRICAHVFVALGASSYD